jgi:hypothetical protein
MEERAPEPSRSAPDSLIGEAAEQHLSALEDKIETEADRRRVNSLRYLHEETVRQFVNSPGFGAIRMIPPVDGFAMRGKERASSPVQAVQAPIEVEKPRSASVTFETNLLDLHLSSMLDFTNPAGFGFVKDRKHVAGFQSHAFSKTPDAGQNWKLESVELVGLLLHPEPVVYESPHMPAMEELRGAKTRPPDRFERDALAAIRHGEELVPGVKGDHLRLLGAIRSARQCVDCHGGQRGDLLGAFSYTLKRIEPKR